MSAPSTDTGRPSRTELIRQLDRMLAHPLFRNSRRLSDFLRFVVEQSILGKASDLKEYSVGVQVFGRPAAYNPQEEPIVRIMAGRLRAKLAEYYLANQTDPIIIELPRGGYAPRFSLGAHADASAPAVADRGDHSVGRDREREELRLWFDQLTDTGGRLIGIAGDAGLGKTTFCSEFLRDLESRREAWTASGSCSERLAETDAFAPILEALDGWLRSESGESAAILKAAAPTWCRHLLEGSAGKLASHELLRREFAFLVEQMSRTRPVVLFLDDLHWADASTCDLLAHLEPRLPRVRVLLLATYRPGLILAPGHPFLPLKSRLEAHGRCQELRLDLLSQADVDRFVDSKYPDNRFPPEFTSILYERTEGHPFFLNDLLHYLQQSGVLAQKDGNWVLTRPANAVQQVIPAGTEGMIGIKIGRLDAVDRDILLRGAVQGMEFDSAVVAQVLALDPALVEERLQELDRMHRLVYPLHETDLPAQVPSVRYRFQHVFYQNALLPVPDPVPLRGL